MGAPTTDRGGIQQVIRALKDDGWSLTFVYYGEEDIPVTNETEAIDAVMSVDDAYLNVARGNETGWVRFVLGNAPDEVVNDYTTNLTIVDTLTTSWC